MFSLETIQSLLIAYKYEILFPLSTLEGPVAALISGFLWSISIFNFYIAFAILIAGEMTGDTIYYLIGRYGGRPFIKKWGHIFKINDKKIESTERHYKKHAGKTLIFAKTQAIGAVFLAAAGLAKMPYLKYIFLNFIGSLIKTFILLLLGFYFGQAYVLINKYLGYYFLISVLLIIVFVVIYTLVKRKNEKNNHSN